jgi:hypothetical protein
LKKDLPIGKTLHMRRPFPFDRFVRAPAIKPNEHEFRNESHPFARFDCPSGFLKIRFSVRHSAEQLWVRAYCIEGNKQTELDHDLQTITLVTTTKERQRFDMLAVFPTVGLHKLSLFINTWEQSVTLIDNKQAMSDIPFLNYEPADSGFVPITPTTGLTHIREGFAIIRFIVSIRRSELLFDVLDASGQNFRVRAIYTRLLIDDSDHYEDVTVISFPTPGRWMVKMYLENDIGSFTSFVNYYFDVQGKTDEIISPIECVPVTREFVPLQMPEGLSFLPNSSAVFSSEKSFIWTATTNGDLVLNLKPGEEQTTIFPVEIGRNRKDGVLTIKYRFTVVTPGPYRLVIWFNDGEPIVQRWVVGVARRNVDWVTPKPTKMSGSEVPSRPSSSNASKPSTTANDVIRPPSGTIPNPPVGTDVIQPSSPLTDNVEMPSSGRVDSTKSSFCCLLL